MNNGTWLTPFVTVLLVDTAPLAPPSVYNDVAHVIKWTPVFLTPFLHTASGQKWIVGRPGNEGKEDPEKEEGEETICASQVPPPPCDPPAHVYM